VLYLPINIVMKKYLNLFTQTASLLYLWGRVQAVVYLLAILGLVFYWDPPMLFLSVLGYVLFGMVGLEIAHHRYFCHGSFTCSRSVEWFLLICSIFAVGGGPLYWSGLHRTHHKTADTDADPHRPFDQPILSFLHCNDRTRSEIDWRIVRDLVDKPGVLFLADHYGKVYFGILLAVGLISVKFCLYFLVIPGILTLWATGLINVLGHRVGYRNFDTPDNTRNNTWLNLFTFGGGLHHNHHYNPRSYTTRVKWYEHDLAGWVIKHLLAKEVRT
jgi:stearoyl-CoA desaturase (delta-9 desaturase)